MNKNHLTDNQPNSAAAEYRESPSRPYYVRQKQYNLQNSTTIIMVKPLSFKGDKKTKKRKRVDTAEKFGDPEASTSLTNAKPQEEEAAPDDDTWVTAEAAGDVVGPVVFVLPSDPPSCIACDTNGKVFASALENMIENNPTTAEPHDVRQVWVANKVAGTETYSFKGHHGK